MKQSKANSFAKRTPWPQQTPSSNNTREDSTHGHHQMVNSKIRLIIFSAAKDGEGLYSQQKQDWQLIVAQIMNSLLKNSDLNGSEVSESCSVMPDSLTPWTIQSMEFSRPEYWSVKPFPSPGDLPNPGMEPRSTALQADSLSTKLLGKPKRWKPM